MASVFHSVKSFVTREKAPGYGVLGGGCSRRALRTTSQPASRAGRPWAVEGAVQKCEKRLPRRKAALCTRRPCRTGRPCSRPGAPLPHHLAMPSLCEYIRMAHTHIDTLTLETRGVDPSFKELRKEKYQ